MSLFSDISKDYLKKKRGEESHRTIRFKITISVSDPEPDAFRKDPPYGRPPGFRYFTYISAILKFK